MSRPVFLTGTPLAVRMMDGCLIVTTQPSALMNEVLQQNDRLSAQSRRELEQVIQVLMLREQLAVEWIS